jgi:hypothetical protein
VNRLYDDLSDVFSYSCNRFFAFYNNQHRCTGHHIYPEIDIGTSKIVKPLLVKRFAVI